MNRRITTEHPLHDESGNLIEVGYATEPLLSYDRRRIRASKFRIKEWDYYFVGNRQKGLSFVVADNGYMGVGGVTVFDFEKRHKQDCQRFSILPLGGLNLPPTSSSGRTLFKKGGMLIDMEASPEQKQITIDIDNFADRKPFHAELVLNDIPEETMVIVTPFEKKHAFYYNEKVNCMKASGGYTLGDESVDLTGNRAVLDWGRGVWTYDNTWYWSSLSVDLPDGSTFGFNLGYGFGDTSAASENMVFYRGRAHKLGEVHFGIPAKNGHDDFLSPWNFTSDDGRLALTFEPVFENRTDVNLLLIRHDAHQVFGQFTGRVVLDDGKTLNIEKAFGFAEKVRNRW